MSDSEAVCYRKLSELVSQVDAKITIRKDPTRPYVGLENIPSRGTHLTGWSLASSSISTNSIFQAGDVLFGKLRPNLRKCVVAPFDGYCSTDILVLRANTGVVSSLAGKVLSTEQVGAAAEMTSVGTKMPRTSWKHLRELEVFCPGFPEQSKIAKVLDTLDTAIHETEAIIAKLKAVKQGLLHDLLTRGIDANGEPRPPQAEAPHLYKDSPLGWIPKEWDISGLAGLAPKDRSVIRTGPFGSSLKGEHWRESGRPVVTIGSLGEAVFIASELLYVDEVTAARLADFELIPGDVVFSRVADVGRSVVVSETERGWIMSSNFMRISCDPAKARPHFLQLLLASSVLVRGQLRTTVNSAGRDVANSAVLKGLSFPWPSPREQDEILRRVHAIGQLLIQEQAQLKKLLDGKSGLMDDLLTGRVRVTPLLAGAEREKEHA